MAAAREHAMFLTSRSTYFQKEMAGSTEVWNL